MIVMKFGGTSVGGAEPIRNVVRLVRAQLAEQPIVVVSALSGVTDLLLNLARSAAARQLELVETGLHRFVDRHRAASGGALDDPAIRATALRSLEALAAELEANCRRLFGIELSARELDRIASFGERASATIVAAALWSAGVPSQAMDARRVVVTDAQFGGAQPRLDRTAWRAESLVRPLLNAGITPVVTGYIGATERGETTTLGRGGSDYSASILGHALDSREIWIWTDVSGVLTADPDLVPEARTLPRLSYRQAAALARGGAKVIHPLTMRPAQLRGIPIRIKNSFAPEQPGTVIGDFGFSEPGIKAVTGLGGVRLPPLSGANGRKPDEARRLLSTIVLHEHDLLAELSLAGGRFQVGAHTQSERSGQSLAVALDAPVLTDRGLVTVVGNDLGHAPGLSDRLAGLLTAAGIEAVALAGAGSADAAYLLVPAAALPAAVRLLHAELIVTGSARWPEPSLSSAAVHREPVPGRRGWMLGLV